jgi:spermidine/putrescine transport system ATP-binding protein
VPAGIDQTAIDVQLSGVSKSYDRQTRVVHRLSLDVRRGEFLSLLGPSGCGKTTTLRMIAGLERPDEGTVAIRGAVMNDVPIDRRPTNLVFQNLALFPHLTVFGNVAFGLRLKRVPAAEVGRRVRAMLEMVDLGAFEKRHVMSLSGGQQQRVAIARALVNEPAVLLLDEPLGALDLALQQRLQAELKAIQRRLGITFVYVTHNQTEALAMSNRVAVMRAGRIEQLASTDDIYERPATSFVATFVGSTNLLTARVCSVRDGYAQLEASGLEFRLPAMNGAAVGDAILLSLRPERLRLGTPADGLGYAMPVTDVTPLGATILYRVRSPGGTPLLVQTLAGQALHAPGELVRVSWAADAAVWVRDSGDPRPGAEP